MKIEIKQPTLETERLLLRPFRRRDAADVQRLAGDVKISECLSQVPHPYPDGLAEEWIAGLPEAYKEGRNLNFAMTLKSSGELVGSIGLHPKEDLLRSEIGYWVGFPHWGNGYASEALREMVRFGFEDLTLQRIYANHFVTNPASGRVMEKAGMKYEGLLRLGISRFDELRDSILRAIIKPDWEKAQGA